MPGSILPRQAQPIDAAEIIGIDRLALAVDDEAAALRQRDRGAVRVTCNNGRRPAPARPEPAARASVMSDNPCLPLTALHHRVIGSGSWPW